MTRLTIIPNVEKKRLTFDGRIASGEHVELRVFDFADKIEEGRLRVRAVDFHGNTLAVFPVKARDENGDVKKDENGNDVWEQWGVDEDYGYATCVFNLNTIPALKYFRRGGECLIVLDDPESKTLYGSGHLCVLPWPKEIGKDEPVDLDSYPDNIRDFVRRLDDAEDKVKKCWQDVTSALASVSNANTNANTAVTTAQNAMSASSEAKTSAANALTDSAAAKKAAQDAEGLVSAAQNAAQSAQDAVKNLADVAKSGSYNDLANKPAIPSIKGLATTNEVEKSEARSRAELLVEVSRAKTAEGELDKSIAKKADATALATETQRAKDRERDLEERIAALKSFDVRVVNALPATGLANTVYLVPSANSSDRNVKDEYLWINGAWEQIGSTAVDLVEYAKKSEVPTRFVKDASKSDDGKTLTLTKNDGTIVSFHGGGGGAVVESENKPGWAANAEWADSADIANYSANDAEGNGIVDTYARKDELSLKQDALSEDQKRLLDGGPYLSTRGGLIFSNGNFVSLDIGGEIAEWLGPHEYSPGALSVSGSYYPNGEGEFIPASILKDGVEVATEEQVNAVSDKVDDIKSTVSTDSRFLVNGTTAAIQTRTDETAEWTDEIRIDKGYDAVQGSTMVKLDKSVQTVTVSGGSLTVKLPDAVEGTVRDLCLYVNNTSPTETVTMTFPSGVTVYKSKGGDDSKAAAQAGGITAYYFTEIPGGAWRVMRDELEVAT